jgi:hypothetical protein
MKTYDEMDFHPVSEKLVEILCAKTQNTNPLFFRVLVAYHFSLVASMMRCKIALDDGDIPVNLYACNLATSGSGKGKSMNLMKNKVIDQFRHNFTNITMPEVAEKKLPMLALKRANKKGLDPDEELKLVEDEYKRMGPMFFSFDSGTAPAIKDIRHKLLMIELGSLNLQIDEIGTNLTQVLEILAPYLELYDVGEIGQKLTKNTSDNKRVEEIFGLTPANLIMFGTPARLLNGGKTEDEFMTLQDTGYARRCFVGYSKEHTRSGETDPVKILAARRNNNTGTFMEDLSDELGDLADPVNINKRLHMSDPVQLLFIEYEVQCQAIANAMNEHEEMRKAEITHRYFKAMKLAGAYAFIDGSPEITESHAYYAIKLAEQSGEAFDMLLSRDATYVKLAKFLASMNRPMTQHDLVEALPFYKGAKNVKDDMMSLAIAYGYQNSIIIKRDFTDAVEFIRGETLKVTDLNGIKVSYSQDIAQGYTADTAKFEDLHKMTQLNGIHWCNHAFKGGHRSEDDAIPGFNIVVLDIDHGVNLSTAKMLLKDYKALFYTTKRHTEAENRFRIIIPINYELHLDAKDHKEFWENIYAWLPFEVDHASSQRNRKWLSNNGHYEYQDGQMLDILPFIPKTTKNTEFKAKVLDQSGMDNLQRWVINNIGDGNRNNMLLRFAMILVDGGFDYQGVLDQVTDLNKKIADKLDDAEIMATIMTSVGKALAKR